MGCKVEGVGLLSIVQGVRLVCSGRRVRVAGPALDADAPASMSAAERKSHPPHKIINFVFTSTN